jgi:hypothetical protein
MNKEKNITIDEKNQVSYPLLHFLTMLTNKGNIKYISRWVTHPTLS